MIYEIKTLSASRPEENYTTKEVEPVQEPTVSTAADNECLRTIGKKSMKMQRNKYKNPNQCKPKPGKNHKCEFAEIVEDEHQEVKSFQQS